MSQAIETIQALYRAFRSGDHDAFAELCHPDMQWVQNEGFPYGSTHVGPRAVVSGVFERLASHWEGFGYRDHEWYADGDAVLVIGDYVGTHRETGKAFQVPAVHAYELRDGRVARFRQFTDTALVEVAAGGPGHRADASQRAAILGVLEDYVEGARNADRARLQRAFAPEARLEGWFGPELWAAPIDAYLDWQETQGPASELRYELVSFDVAGSIASARLEFHNWNGERFTDFLTLMEVEGNWSIRQKLFHHHPVQENRSDLAPDHG